MVLHRVDREDHSDENGSDKSRDQEKHERLGE
jgi:hypothetical protein